VVPTLHLTGIGWYFALCLLLGVWLGSLIDGATGLDPTFKLVGLGFGLILALVGGYRMLIQFITRYGGESTESR
jgi:hypothetical protein